MQGRFVSGRFTPLMLLVVSVLMWLVGVLFDRPVDDAGVYGLQIGNVVSRCITFACFALATAMLSSWYVFDRRICWFLSLVFFLPSVSLFVHGSVESSLSLLFLLLVQSRLFSCNQGEDNRYALFMAFLLFGLTTMFFPACIMLLLPFIYYIMMLSLVRVKELLSIVLGVLTPYWFLFGIDYIFPEIMVPDKLQTASMAYVTSMTLQQPSLQNLLLVAVGLLVLVPFVLLFSKSATPGKPLLRKRLQYFAVLESYMLILSLLYSQDHLLYYIWSLPVIGIMLTYVFSLNITRFSKIYFIFMALVWLAMIPYSLCLTFL